MSCEDKYSHSFFGGVCVNCGISQLDLSGKGFKKAEPIRKPQKKINSEFQYEVDRLMTYLGEDVYKKGNFAKYAGIYKRLGKQRVTSLISYMKEKKITSSRYFMAMTRSNPLKK